MKIIKLSQDFQIIPQDPNKPSDPNVQLQNLQNAQQALNYFEELIASSERVMAALRDIEETLGVGDIGMRNQFAELIRQAAMRTPAFNLLAQMNFVSSIDNLLDRNQISSVNMIITNNLQAIQSGAAEQSSMITNQ